MKIRLAENLKREIRLRNEKVKAIALSTGIAETTLRDWIEGVFPSGKNLVFLGRLAQYFDLSIADLLFEDGDNSTSREIIARTNFKIKNERFVVTVERLK